jgi:Ni/Fe-hydrogenase subunit HybB-like protein
MPYRLHPLWYSTILPLLFLISAVGLGMMMLIAESHFTAYLYRRKPETGTLEALAAAARWPLLAYLLVRFAYLAIRRQLSGLNAADWRAGLLWL